MRGDCAKPRGIRPETRIGIACGIGSPPRTINTPLPRAKLFRLRTMSSFASATCAICCSAVQPEIDGGRRAREVLAVRSIHSSIESWSAPRRA